MNKQTSSPYLHLDREKWATLRDENDEALTLTQEELDIMKGINHRLSIEEVKDVYLPLSRLLYYYVHAQTNRQTVLTFIAICVRHQIG